MNRWCVIDASVDVVENIIVWDGVSSYTPPEGRYLIEAPDEVDIGWMYDKQRNDFFEFSS